MQNKIFFIEDVEKHDYEDEHIRVSLNLTHFFIVLIRFLLYQFKETFNIYIILIINFLNLSD